MGDSDSEDSDGEGGLGNVSRVIIRPPGQSGKAKRGHLCFDAAFETGNLGKAELVGDFEYDLFLRPDTCNPHFRFWFNFTVDNVRQDQRVLFHIVNISKARNLFNCGLTPLVKSSSRPKWQYLPKKHVFYYRSAMHQNHYVLSFAFSFDREEDVYQFALSPPYSYSRLQSYLNVIDSRQSAEKRFERSVLTKTLQNRNLDLITIDHVTENAKAHPSEKGCIRVIIILCRSHSGEAPASFVCQGFIEFLISNHPVAVMLRANFVFKIVPMLNPDGVFLGNNRCNLIGQDLNRTWHVATEFSHPTLHAVKGMMKQYDNSEIYQIDFVIDLHTHSSLHGCFIYGNTYEDVYRYERHLVFPRLFASNATDYVPSNMMFNADERKMGAVRRYCCERMSDTLNAYSLEVSFGGQLLKDGITVAPYNEDGYCRVGRNLARTFLQYYRFINVLAMPLAAELTVKQRQRRRPRTNNGRSRSLTRHEVKPRPKTTRCYAPISYTNLSICYDSCASDEGGYSPVRSSCNPNFIGNPRFSRRRTMMASSSGGGGGGGGSGGPIYDQFTFMSPGKASANVEHVGPTVKYSNSKSAKAPPLDKGNGSASRSLAAAAPPINIPPKPFLSIIDLNQLTRGSLNVESISLDN